MEEQQRRVVIGDRVGRLIRSEGWNSLQVFVHFLIDELIEQCLVRSFILVRIAVGALDFGALALYRLARIIALILTREIGTQVGLLLRIGYVELFKEDLQLRLAFKRFLLL